MTFTIF